VKRNSDPLETPTTMPFISHMILPYVVPCNRVRYTAFNGIAMDSGSFGQTQHSVVDIAFCLCYNNKSVIGNADIFKERMGR